jgi:hypothetical protein
MWLFASSLNPGHLPKTEYFSHQKLIVGLGFHQQHNLYVKPARHDHTFPQHSILLIFSFFRPFPFLFSRCSFSILLLFAFAVVVLLSFGYRFARLSLSRFPLCIWTSASSSSIPWPVHSLILVGVERYARKAGF